jgi:hypothetical protein
MKIRNAAICLAASAAFAGSAGLALVGMAGVAGAANPPGTITVTNPDPTSGQAITPGTPFASGQTVEVSAPANSVLSPSQDAKIIECADPGGLASNLPTSTSGCDTSTVQGDNIFPNSDGSFDYFANDPNGDAGYQVYALPESTGPSPITCGSSTTPCVLWIGDNYSTNFTSNLWSAPFQVRLTNADQQGENPGDGTPEVPLAIGLPLAAAGLFAGGLAIRRRRADKAHAA